MKCKNNVGTQTVPWRSPESIYSQFRSVLPFKSTSCCQLPKISYI